MTEEKKKELVERHDNYVRIAVYNILFTNDLVREWTSHAMMRLRDSSLDRHLVKYHRKRVEKFVDAYQKRIDLCVKELKNKLEAYTDEFSAEVDSDMEAFYRHTNEAFEKTGVPHPDIMALCEAARLLAAYSVLQLNKRIQELKDIDPLFGSFDMSHLNMLDISRALDCLVASFEINCTVDIGTDECRDIFNKLKKTLANVKLIEKSINIDENEE